MMTISSSRLPEFLKMWGDMFTAKQMHKGLIQLHWNTGGFEYIHVC